MDDNLEDEFIIMKKGKPCDFFVLILEAGIFSNECMASNFSTEVIPFWIYSRLMDCAFMFRK